MYVRHFRKCNIFSNLEQQFPNFFDCDPILSMKKHLITPASYFEVKQHVKIFIKNPLMSPKIGHVTKKLFF